MKTTLEFKWTVSRGRDTYGYNICTLYADGRRVARCNGGGYDMKGTCLGNYIAGAFGDRLLALPLEAFPEQSHWQPDEERTCAGACRDAWRAKLVETISAEEPAPEELPLLARDCWECPVCKGRTAPTGKGKRVNDGRSFYGLTFHDPDYNPGKAIVGKNCTDRTLAKVDGASEGKTVEQVEAEGVSFGLERYQAFYSASSKTPDAKHRVPLIDGACGFSSVETIANAIGLSLEYVAVRSKKLDVYHLIDSRAD